LTLVIALCCREGAVLAADNQLTYREGRARTDMRVTRTTPVTKLHAERGIAWGWGGREDANSTPDRDALRISLSKVSDNADLNLLLSGWSPSAGKAPILRARGLRSTIARPSSTTATTSS
jgi:hypothetical protein